MVNYVIYFFHRSFLSLHYSNNVYVLLCMFVFFSWSFGMFTHHLVVFFEAITSSSVLSYLNHWTGSIHFLFYLGPNHRSFRVKQKRLGYIAVKKRAQHFSDISQQNLFLAQSALWPGHLSEQLFSTWCPGPKLFSSCDTSFSIQSFGVHSAGVGNMDESVSGIQCISQEVTAVISVDIPLAIT